MLTTVILHPLNSSSSSSSSSLPPLSSTEIANHFCSSSSSSSLISVGQVLSIPCRNSSCDYYRFKVIETSPIIKNGKVDPSSTEWIILSAAAGGSNDDEDEDPRISDALIMKKMAGYFERSLLASSSPAVMTSDDHDHETDMSDENQQEDEIDEEEPLFVLGDFLKQQQKDKKRMSLVNLSSLPSLMFQRHHRTQSGSSNSSSTTQRQKKALGPVLVRIVEKIISSLGDDDSQNEKRKRSRINEEYNNNNDNNILVTSTSLRYLELRHQSVITLDHREGEEKEEDSTSSQNSSSFRLEMIDTTTTNADDINSNSLSLLFDALCGGLNVLFDLTSSSSSSSESATCFGFISSPEVFYNLKNRLTLFVEEEEEQEEQQESRTQHDDDNLLLSNLFVTPKNTSSSSTATTTTTASSIILRPLTRNIVTDSIDTTTVLHIRRETHLIGKCLRTGDVISLPRNDSIFDVDSLNASPLANVSEVLSKPMNPTCSPFCPQTAKSVYFYIEKVSGDDGKEEANDDERLMKIAPSTAVIEGAPFSSSELFLPVPDIITKANNNNHQLLLPFSAPAFSRTKSFTEIFQTCSHLFGGSGSSGSSFSSSFSCSSSSNFKLCVLSSSSPKTASLQQLQIAFSSLGIYFEVAQPHQLISHHNNSNNNGTVENLKALANLVCNAHTSTGVLVLYCAENTLFEHSEVVQWLVASSKQHLPLRVVLISESGDSSQGALAVLNTVSSVPTIDLDVLATEEGEHERRVCIEDLICCLRNSYQNNDNSYSNGSSSSPSLSPPPPFLFSHFLNFATLAESSAGLFPLELYQWLQQSILKSQQQQQQQSLRLIDQSFLIQQLESFKKQHGHNVTSTKLHEVRWSDIGGLQEQREEIMTVLRPPSYLSNSHTKRRTAVLLYGPPGCGKTLLAKAVATECGMNFLSVKGPELLNMYVGQSEKNIRDTFRRAREAAPCIIFFDELDALAPARGAKGDSGGVMDRIVAQLLVELDGAASSSSSSKTTTLHHDDDQEDEDENNNTNQQKEREKKMVFVIGATNRPDLLDPSLLRPGRFDRMSYVGMAETKSDQIAAIRALTRKFNLAEDISSENGNLEKFLEDHDVKCIYSGADYYGFCADAMTIAVSEAVKQFQDDQREKENSRSNNDDDDNEKQQTSSAQPTTTTPTFVVSKRHFEEALVNLSPSVPSSELQKYQQLRKQYAVKKDG